ncbi:sce7726 family protein [uncultured Croceitalea sp.]|uniref:sce7726 family protein n=1 Tax=uncultured Croceitalea sp. TaxID=1798908 RepID=UPI0033065921
MEITTEISKIRSLSQIISPANFKKIVRKGDCYSTFYKIKKYTTVTDSTTNLDAINFIYKSLLKNYKNEYVYKNILTNKLLLKKYSLRKTIALNEFNIGKSIADFVLLNGEARVYEIKTELDNLEKLDKQVLDYIPTQYISEFIKSLGFDGVEYQSSLNSEGYNIAIFNPEKLECFKTNVYEIKDIKLTHGLIK